ncbi:MAG TPA: MFS transporter, partial [Phycisphaerae bacterium]
MVNESEMKNSGAARVLWVSTAGFTLLFAVWLMFGVLALPIRKELSLSDVQFAWLTAIAILNGSIWRLAFGILADRQGGRRVMTGLLLATAVPTALVSFAHSYGLLLFLAFCFGMAGNAFSAGVAWNSAWFPQGRKGFALGVFGAGNVGASVTKLIGPAMITLIPAAGMAGGVIPGGWRFIPLMYAVLLVVMGVITWLVAPVDVTPSRGRAIRELLRPLGCVRVWRFCLYYVVMFGAYVALSV